MAKDNCIFDPTRNKFGFNEVTWNRIKSAVGDQVPTRGKFTNIVRNLGVDDTRMVNVKGEDGSRFFGKNITEVSDLDLSKKIPEGAVVRVPTKQGEQYFVANKDGVQSAPSRWVRDEFNGALRLNPEWDQLNRNVTEMKRYVKDDDRYWREAGPNEEGSFLNIQNPSKRRYNKQEIQDRGIDAFEVDGRYELIDESAQAVNPRMITEKPSRDATLKETTDKAPDANNVGELLSQYNVPRNVASAVAGGVVGNFADQDGEFGGTFWGGALGLMIGSPKIRGKFKGVYNKTSGRGADAYDNIAADLTQAERQHALREEAKYKGYKGDTTDMQAVEKFMGELNRQQALKESGDWSMKTMFDNSFFRSGEGLFRNMSKVGKDLFNVLRGFESKPRKMYAEFADLQTRAFGRENTKEAFKTTQVDFVRAVSGSQDIPEEQALQSFGASVKRLITYNGRIEDGQFKFDESDPSRQLYSDPDVRAIDEALLQDENARKVLDVTRQFFERRGENALEIIDRTLNKELNDAGIPPKVKAMFEDVLSKGMTFKQYKKAYPDKAKQVDTFLAGKFGDPNLEAQHRANTQRIEALVEDRKRFSDLQGRYFPQKFSQVKEAREKRSWMSRNEGEFRARDMTSEQIEEQWELHKASQIMSQNKEKWQALEINEDGMDVNKMFFGDRRKAIEHVKRSIEEINDETKRRALQTDVQQGNFDDYLVRTPDGEGGFKYEVTTPQRYRDDDWFPNGIYETKNMDVSDRANRAFVSVNLSKNADHFDRPRNMDIPTQYLETDIEKLVKFYSDDMSIRLHAIDNGMYDSNAVQKNWIYPIKQELQGKFGSEHELNTKLNEVESWISLMQGKRAERKVGMNEADRRRMRTEATNQARNDSFFNSIAKIATMPFNYGTTLYSMFTPLVLGPFLTSYKSVLREYKNGFIHPKGFAGELSNFTKEIEKMGVIQKKFENFAPEYKRQFRDDLLGDPTSWRRRLADFSDGATNFTANLSLARMAKIDPENLGIARLAVGNMLDISGAEAGLVTMSAFRHIEDLLEAGKALKKQNSVQVGNRSYNQQTLKESFERLGITEPEKFINKSDEFSKFNEYMRGKGDIDSFDTDFYAQMSELTNTIIDQYHGRTKMSRPLKWMDNVWGRALSRYSVYAQNFGVQTTANRIYRPIKDWGDRYEMADEKTPLFKLAVAAATGQDQVFKKQFGENWQAAYDDFPMEAVHNFYKVFGTLGVGSAMMITRGGVLDITEMATNEALGNDDYEAWKNVRKNLALGTYADTGEEFYISDFFSGDVQGYDVFKAFMGQLGNASRLGFGGRYAQVLSEDLRYTQGGIAEMTPVTGLPNDIFERVGSITHNTDIGNLPKTIARESLDFLTLRGTPFGTFAGMREGLVNFAITKPSNRSIKYADPTGNELDVNLYNP